MLYLYDRPDTYTTSYKVCFVFCWCLLLLLFLLDSFTLFTKQNCFRGKPTEQTLILLSLIFAHWQTRGESSLDQLLRILWMQSNQWGKWLISPGEAVSEVFEDVRPMQRAITLVTQVLNTGLQGGYLNQVAIRFNSLLAIGCGNIAYSLISCGSHHVS